MPRDARLYMTFPNDMWMHPKVAPLSDAAFRAFVEMNGYSRMQDLDGRIPMVMVARMWPAAAVDELLNSHQERPLVLLDEECLLIRDYAEHQQTTAQREDLHAKRVEAGRKGGLSKRQANALAKRKPTVAETETETETETEISTPNGVETRTRAHSIPLNFTITPRMREWAAVNVPLVDVDRTLPEFIDFWRGVGKPMKDWESVWHNGMRKQQGFAERDRTTRRQTPEERMRATIALGNQQGAIGS